MKKSSTPRIVTFVSTTTTPSHVRQFRCSKNSKKMTHIVTARIVDNTVAEQNLDELMSRELYSIDSY